MKRFVYRTLLIASAVSMHPALAGDWDVSGSFAGEVRIFPKSPAFPTQKNATISPSFSATPEFVYDDRDRENRYTFTPFLRWNASDANRTHADIREANWLHSGESWDLVAGISKVFWGVTESRHLVDIINQTDAVEDINGQDKLGQPMINFNLIFPQDSLRVFVLPGFRTRAFPANNARLRGPLPIDNNPVYQASTGKQHVDGAIRWTHTAGEWDIGLAHFYGTSREPRLLPRTDANGRTSLIPYYDLIHQTSLDLQLTKESTLWKLEAITRGGQGNRFFAAVAGLEYTFYGAFKTPTDLGVLAEYLYDGRNPATAPATTANNDVFFGARLTLNDVQGTQFLGGVVVDHHTQAAFYRVEAERRIGQSSKISITGRFFANVPASDPVSGIRNDGFITLRLSQYF